MSKSEHSITISLGILSFLATLAIFRHPRDGVVPLGRPAPQVSSPTLINVPAVAAGGVAQELAAQPPAPRTSSDRAAPVAATVPEPASTIADDTRATDEVVPVNVSFRHRRDAGAPNEIEAGMVNMSFKALDVTVLHVDASTGQQDQVQITAQPAVGRSIGVDDGWSLKPGDTVIVQSPPFRDHAFRVP